MQDKAQKQVGTTRNKLKAINESANMRSKEEEQVSCSKKEFCIPQQDEGTQYTIGSLPCQTTERMKELFRVNCGAKLNLACFFRPSALLFVVDGITNCYDIPMEREFEDDSRSFTKRKIEMD